MRECPCKGCTKRHIGCHGKCTEYQEWAKEQRKINVRRKHLENATIKRVDWNTHTKW